MEHLMVYYSHKKDTIVVFCGSLISFKVPVTIFPMDRISEIFDMNILIQIETPEGWYIVPRYTSVNNRRKTLLNLHLSQYATDQDFDNYDPHDFVEITPAFHKDYIKMFRVNVDIPLYS